MVSNNYIIFVFNENMFSLLIIILNKEFYLHYVLRINWINEIYYAGIFNFLFIFYHFIYFKLLIDKNKN